MKHEFILVDLQNDFATKGGKFYSYKPSVSFLHETIFPFLKANKLKVNEIISDYRQPRPGDRGDCCHPGTWGYESLLPAELRKSLWVKCMNSPLWIREYIGKADKVAGLPYQDTKAFGLWLEQNIGDPKDTVPVLMGLTIDCCVLSSLQELSWRGYSPTVIREAVDHATGEIVDRDKVLETPVSNWADVLNWNDFMLSS